jgi:hypothetical protein
MFSMSLADLANAHQRDMDRKTEQGAIGHDARRVLARGRLAGLLTAGLRNPYLRRSGLRRSAGAAESCETERRLVPLARRCNPEVMS